MSVDEVTLTLPRERGFYRIAGLVLGGLAARHDVTLERLEDVELALDGLLDRLDGDEPATVRMRVADGELRAVVGPFGGRLRSELERDSGRELGLRRLLDAVVDRYELVGGDGGDWIELAKAVE
ncbi:MAG: hypothetical protein ICV64_03100 [Thermoleophilia bacterium]|nr:hypothetical protein [Thermoleophilia bacterium]